MYFLKLYGWLFLGLIALFPLSGIASDQFNVPVLCYHNFNPTTPGSMNLTPQRLETQFKWLKDNGFTVIPLKEVVAYLQGKRPALPKKSVVITVDDGWHSVYSYVRPLAEKYHYPVTLFVYPQTISSGKNALTWQQLKELQNTGLFDIQGHTYSHPNFKQEKKHLSEPNYEKFVKNELVNSKKILEEKLGHPVSLLAWPFGIYNQYLEQEAANAGYEMAFSIDGRTANKSFRPMAQPRFMIIDKQSMQTFAQQINQATH